MKWYQKLCKLNNFMYANKLVSLHLKKLVLAAFYAAIVVKFVENNFWHTLLAPVK